jgi:hypothetical protein
MLWPSATICADAGVIDAKGKTDKDKCKDARVPTNHRGAPPGYHLNDPTNGKSHTISEIGNRDQTEFFLLPVRR